MRAALALATLTTALAAGAPAHAASAPAAFIRVDQVGFAPAEAKHAYLMTAKTGTGAAGRFSVVDRHGRTVLAGTTGRDLGAWNARYPHVHDLDLTRLRAPGAYRVKVGAVTSPEFEVAAGLPAAPARRIVDFFGLQRDGAAARGGPSHLNDRAASVYAWPKFTGPDTDQIKGGLTRIGGGPVDAEGGWFDAGDYLKFTHILSYVDTLLWAAERDGTHVPHLRAEAAHGLRYLEKMWDQKTRTLYIQVGIGAGDKAGTFAGDHDIWRLPQADDAAKGGRSRFIRHRPLFRAAAPGKPISPNLAGRTAAAFALAAQLEPSRKRAEELLDKAASVYAMAKTTGVGRLVTSLPHAFYPESVWRDDMELGGAQLALAARRLGDPRAGRWLAQAARWAAEYLGKETGDTFNLYDVSALAHTDLIRAIRRSGTSGLAVSEAGLVAGLRAQLETGARRAAADPFRAGADYAEFDSVPHAFGLAATSRLYRSVTGDRSYDAFGTGQRNWAQGTNPWGVSFIAEVGEHSIACPHHQIANITGRPAAGAVVNGPNGAKLFADGLGERFDEMPPCPPGKVDRYKRFTGRGSRFVDDVRSWQTSEPADDFAAVALYALTLTSPR
ncbi:hydrolase [Sphaerisporangium rufum]|uniref:Hydrolase n=2 Tax=Sphaerisporangium rufum TaxID=1381558 RepID=A0A919R7Q0_9ACTN|nr:hydrolase [Sphaerisporangium rufum]